MIFELNEELDLLIDAHKLGPDDTFFFQGKNSKPICHENFIRWQFRQALKKWGGRKIRFHDLRHTSTTLMIAKGVDIKTVKEICGHADNATTMNYVHMISGSIERVSETFSIKPTENKVKEVEANLSMLKIG